MSVRSIRSRSRSAPAISVADLRRRSSVTALVDSSAQARERGKGRAAHLPPGRGPARPPRRSQSARAAGACVALVVVPALRRRAATAAAPLDARGSRRRSRVPGISPAQSSALAIDLATGQTLFARNADRSLAPASNEKLAVTYAALVELGTSYRFRTARARRRRARSGNAWHGDVFPEGLRRPDARRRAELERLAGQLTRARHHAASTAACSATSRGSTRSERRRAGSRRSSSTSRRRSRRSSSTAAGTTATRRGSPRWQPRGRFDRLLRAARDHGRASRRGRTALLRRVRRSRRSSRTPLPDVLKEMDRDSDNFTAELILKELGAEAGDAGTTAAGAASCCAISRTPACRSQACGCSTAPGLSLDDRLPRARSRRCSSSPGTTPTCGPVLRPRCRSRASTARSRTACSARPRAAPCARRRARRTGRRRSRATCATATCSRSSRTAGRCRRGRRARRRTASRRRSRQPSVSSVLQLGLAEQRHAGLLRLRDLRAGLSPTNTPVVFFDTLSETLAPSASSAAFASSRDIDSSVPVITYWLPVSGPSTGRSSSPASKRRPSARSSATSARVVVVGEPLGDRLGPLGADALALHDLLLRRGGQPVDAAEVAREVLRGHPADVGDVEAEEHAPERDLLRRLDRVDRVGRGDLARNRRARAAAPSSAGTAPAASARARAPRGAARAARRRRRCRPQPAPS